MVKPRYILLNPKNLQGYFIVKRTSGGSVSGGWTITEYEVIYPQEIDAETKRSLRRHIKGDGRSVLPTIYKKERFYEKENGIIKDIFEKITKK